MGSRNVGGQVARNFRPGQIAEGLAFDLCRPFMAMAHLDQEEDFGIDFIGTLLKRSKKTFTAELSCMIQAKIAGSARFHIQGLGVNWLRRLVLPYFPLVVDRSQASATLYTLNDWHWVVHLSRVDEYVFVLDEDMENDPGDSFFSLGEPLMSWDIEESAHPDFVVWAYSVLQPAIEIETSNQRYGSTGRFEKLVGRNYRFSERGDDNSALNPPKCGAVNYQYAGNHDGIRSDLKAILNQFAYVIANTPFDHDISSDLEELKEVLSKLGIEVNQPELWQQIVGDMKEYNEPV